MVSKSVVVTGMEMISPLGLDKESTFDQLCKGTKFSSPSLDIKAFNAKEFIESSVARKMSNVAKYGVVAAKKALVCAGITVTPENCRNIGIISACAFGAGKAMDKYLTTIEKLGGSKASPISFVSIMHQETAAQLSINLGVKGFHLTFATMGSGIPAIGCGVDMIKSGRAEIVIICGSEEISPTVWELGKAVGFFTREEDSSTCKLFSKHSSGTFYGEGAGVIILESKESAEKRGARIYGEIKGCGNYNYAMGEMYMEQQGKGTFNAIQKALSKSGLSPSNIDSVFLGANGYLPMDMAEIQGLKQIAFKENTIFTAVKSMLGEAFGASGLMQVICALMSLNTSLIPPTASIDSGDLEMHNNIGTEIVKVEIYNALISSTYPDGESAALIVGV